MFHYKPSIFGVPPWLWKPPHPLVLSLLHLPSGLRLAECVAEQRQSLRPTAGSEDRAGSAQERGGEMPHLRARRQAGATGSGCSSKKIGELFDELLQVSMNGDIPKWMVWHGQILLTWMIGG